MERRNWMLHLCRASILKFFTVSLLALISHATFAAIAYQQSEWETQIPPQSMIRVWIPGAQTAGNLNVVIIGWADSTSTIVSVVDIKGNSYVRAVGPTVSSGNAQQAIYYAKNIVSAAANINAVTVTFNTPVLDPDVRVAEYSGLNTTSPFDGAIGASGSGSSLNSGSITTTNARDLLITGNYVETSTASLGSGYTQRLFTNEDQFLADKSVTATGSYNATATQSGCCYWIQQVVAFKMAVGASAAYVQSAWVTQTSPPPQSSIGYAFSNAQIAGNFNVVSIGWADSTASIVSVTDTKGNVYTKAVGPTISSGKASQSLYYAKNIVAAAAGANTITVTFNTAVRSPDLRIAEYSGVDTTSPFESATGASGTGTALDSGTIVTANANDLLIGTNYIEQTTTAVGAGFTLREQSDEEDILADKVVSSTGTYNATATQDQAGYWIMQVAAFKAAASGTPPNPPTNLAATPTSSTQINVSWTASTSPGVNGYTLERCQASTCVTFTPTTTSYSDTGLTASTVYSYRVKAKNTAGLFSAYTSAVNATTQANPTAPNAPTNLAATAVSTTQINVSWTASTSPGVNGYTLERCQASTCVTFTPTTTSYSDIGLIASTVYSYRVKAKNTAGLFSAYTSAVNATTQANPTAPNAPTNLAATAVSTTQINVSWTASTSPGVNGYTLERCQASTCVTFTPTGTTYSDTGLIASTVYSYRVKAQNTAGLFSAYTSAVTATTVAAPAPPTALNVTAKSNVEIDIAWTASVSGGITGYLIERCQGVSCSSFSQLGSATTNTYLYDAGLTANTSYTYRIRALAGASNPSNYSSVLTTVTLTTATCD